MTKPQTVKDVLIQARALIADRDHWCQGDLAQDNCGAGVLPTAESAVCFCAYGAIARACGTIDLVINPNPRVPLDTASNLASQASYALQTTARGMFGVGVTDVNDLNDPEPAHCEVLRMFDAAIEQAAS